ncbi:MAG: indolepyruvate oxidoreductase subunit beta family protein [Rhodobacteraceae bacterium]|nr:indolepyruvate oxidoreductase subunit beta family protein [Paracoccaceae bacterium]
MNGKPPLRILIAALGGEGGGVLMNWIVEAARQAGFSVQATSVPGVAQRTGSTSYYIEIAEQEAVFSLVPVPGRVDLLISSELVETARALVAGFVSPAITTVISSTARSFTTAEKSAMGDGRYQTEGIIQAAGKLARTAVFLDLTELAESNRTFVSATLFGAVSASNVLPWEIETSRQQLATASSLRGFDAAATAVREELPARESETASIALPGTQFSALPEDLQMTLSLGQARCTEFQDAAYGEQFLDRAARLTEAADPDDHGSSHALNEAFRRLALWMAYEDVARVAFLKTRTERFESIRQETRLEPGQTITVTEYMKPRIEELADILPTALGARLMRLAGRGGFPGLHIRSNGVIGYWLLRTVAGLRVFRRRSLRYRREQAEIDEWLLFMEEGLRSSAGFAAALAELPRVLKGYSDTHARGRRAYRRIMDEIVRPAARNGFTRPDTERLRSSIDAALSDDGHTRLDSVLGAAQC